MNKPDLTLNDGYAIKANHIFITTFYGRSSGSLYLLLRFNYIQDNKQCLKHSKLFKCDIKLERHATIFLL